MKDLRRKNEELERDREEGEKERERMRRCIDQLRAKLALAQVTVFAHSQEKANEVTESLLHVSGRLANMKVQSHVQQTVPTAQLVVNWICVLPHL